MYELRVYVASQKVIVNLNISYLSYGQQIQNR